MMISKEDQALLRTKLRAGGIKSTYLQETRLCYLLYMWDNLSMLKMGSSQGMQNGRKARSSNVQLQTDVAVWELGYIYIHMPVLGTLELGTLGTRTFEDH